MAQMTIADQIWSLWKERLSKSWKGYFREVGLDLPNSGKDAFLGALDRGIDKINRDRSGLKDFAADGERGIEPAQPARSLFYHVLASPLVIPEGIEENEYPTFGELEIVENYIYSVKHASLADLVKEAKGASLGVAVFAYEYVPAWETVHQQHADLCFSRTGIARVGNAPAQYVAKARGYFPYSQSKNKVHVVPVRYGTFIAAKMKGDPCFLEKFAPGDADREFWVPLHKLFNGPECLKGLDLKVNLHAFHRNEKIRKVHLALQTGGISTGWNAAHLTQPPFLIESNMAEMSGGPGLLMPVPHDPLIEPATTPNGKLVGFPVPPDGTPLFVVDPRLVRLHSSLWFRTSLDTRSSPEFVHVRHGIRTGTNGKEEVVDLLDEYPGGDINEIVKNGNYQAVNFVDRTADGFIKPEVDGLPKEFPRLAACSIIGQPDFFPRVRQQDLNDWLKDPQDHDLKKLVWPDLDAAPTPLSLERSAGNITLKEPSGAPAFDSKDDTVAAIVSMKGSVVPGKSTKSNSLDFRHKPVIQREATLSYRASSLFEPGWDISADFGRDRRDHKGTKFLANYGLGSPYAEDTLICAAFGAFWPGAVPDVTRFFALEDYPSSTPILDDEAYFSGIPLPVPVGSSGDYRFSTYGYSDFVTSIWRGQLAYNAFAHVNLEEYLNRTMATARVFCFLGLVKPHDRAKLAFVNFRKASEADYAKRPDGWPSSIESTYWVKVAEILTINQDPGDPSITDVKLDQAKCLLASYKAAALIKYYGP